MANETKEQPATSVDFTKTPEFAQAVTAGIAAALPDLIGKQMEAMKAELLASIAPSAPEPDGKTTAILQALAMQIGVVADQGTNRKRLAPEEIRERANAFERMGVLLTAAIVSDDINDKPKYRVAGKLYFGDQQIDPFQRLQNRDIIETEVWFDGIPNTSMRPINPVAEAVYAEFIRWIGGSEAVNGVPKPVQPMWITRSGRVIIGGQGSETAAAHGMMRQPEPLIIAGGKRVGAPPATVEIVSPTDPRATKVPVLGSIHPAATVGGTTAKLA